jgi:hypothetical protein
MDGVVIVEFNPLLESLFSGYIARPGRARHGKVGVHRQKISERSLDNILEWF